MLTQARHALIRLLSRPPDPSVVTDPDSWELIRKFAAPYGVNGPVAFAARPFATGDARAWCDAVLTSHWRRHDQSLLDLGTVLTYLREAGVRPLVLKGPMLARRHYRPPIVRKPSIDIDLAVRDEELEAACTALIGAGYELHGSIREAKAYSRHVLLLHTTLPRVELHFRLSHGLSGIAVDGFFDRAVSSSLPSGEEILILDPADELLHLVLHFAHHRFPIFFNLHELRLIWNDATPDVQRSVIRMACEHHFVSALRMTEIAFRTIWGEPFLPDDVALPKTWLDGRLNGKLYEECVAWSEPGFRLTLAKRIRGRWIDFQLTDRPRDLFGFVQMFLSVGGYRLRQRAWGTLEYPHFVLRKENRK